MSEYEQDIFYDVRELSLSEKKALLTDTYLVCDTWWVDVLVGFQRSEITMSFDEILSRLKDDDHFIFIHRRGFQCDDSGEYTIETGFSTMSSPSLFLFIRADLKHLEPLTTKYNLHVRND